MPLRLTARTPLSDIHGAGSSGAVVPRHVVRPGRCSRGPATQEIGGVIAHHDIECHRGRDLLRVIPAKPGERPLGVQRPRIVLQNRGQPLRVGQAHHHAGQLHDQSSAAASHGRLP
jgi:hypothetical protein